MQKISLNQAEEDMVLAYDAAAPDGRELAPAGSVLDDAILRRLELAGVKRLVVHGKPVPGADMGYNAQARAQRLEHLFRAHHGDRFMMTLKNVLIKHFTERI